MVIGWIGVLASRAAASKKPWIGSTASPELVVPSGNTRTDSPVFRHRLISDFIRLAWPLPRWMNKVPACLASQPIIGQLPTSALDRNLNGVMHPNMGMSDQLMWLAT